MRHKSREPHQSLMKDGWKHTACNSVQGRAYWRGQRGIDGPYTQLHIFSDTERRHKKQMFIQLHVVLTIYILLKKQIAFLSKIQNCTSEKTGKKILLLYGKISR